MMYNLSIAASGAVFFGYVVVALFFLRFWRQTGARLFGWFAIAFAILAVERVLLVGKVVEPIHQPLVYCTRMIAFLVIAWAIWDANRRDS